jgi:hypothetical protein
MYEDRVARGAAWLDKEVGTHWPLLIDVDKLSMSSCFHCIIGQVYHLTEGSEQDFWGVLQEQGESSISFTYDHGFSLSLAHEKRSWFKLGEAWVAEIKRRLDEGIVV